MYNICEHTCPYMTYSSAYTTMILMFSSIRLFYEQKSKMILNFRFFFQKCHIEFVLIHVLMPVKDIHVSFLVHRHTGKITLIKSVYTFNEHHCPFMTFKSAHDIIFSMCLKMLGCITSAHSLVMSLAWFSLSQSCLFNCCLINDQERLIIMSQIWKCNRDRPAAEEEETKIWFGCNIR